MRIGRCRRRVLVVFGMMNLLPFFLLLSPVLCFYVTKRCHPSHPRCARIIPDAVFVCNIKRHTHAHCNVIKIKKMDITSPIFYGPSNSEMPR